MFSFAYIRLIAIFSATRHGKAMSMILLNLPTLCAMRPKYSRAFSPSTSNKKYRFTDLKKPCISFGANVGFPHISEYRATDGAGESLAPNNALK